MKFKGEKLTQEQATVVEWFISKAPKPTTEREQLKYELCEQVCLFLVREQLSIEDLARILMLDAREVLYILDFNYSALNPPELSSVSSLIDSYYKLQPKLTPEQKDLLNTNTSVAGRSTIDSLDLCDFFKREVMSFFIGELRQGRFNINNRNKAFLNETEATWVLMSRTDKLTLDRLLELKSAYLGTDERAVLRGKFIPRIIAHPDFSKIKLNRDIRGHLIRGGSELITADFLVNLLERLGE